MTVIAFRNGIMASDGRVTEDASIFTNKLQKIFRLKNGGLYGAAGDADDRDLLDLLNKCKTKLPTHKQIIALGIEFSSIVVDPDGTVHIIEASKAEKDERWIAQIYKLNEPFIAVGSGREFAMGAMDRGASAEQAVLTAIKYNNTCGGKVQSFKLNDLSNG